MVRQKGSETAIAAGRDSRKSHDAAILRRIADMLSLWRLCGNAACRRAKACAAGRIVAPSGTSPPSLPASAASSRRFSPRSRRLGFETFQEEMAGSLEAEAYFAWVAAANGRLFSSQVRNKRDAPQNAA
jgi:hypothetical protein